MPQDPLDDLTAQLDAQNAELARLATLLDEIPPGVAMSSGRLDELDELTEPPRAACPVATPFFALRA